MCPLQMLAAYLLSTREHQKN